MPTIFGRKCSQVLYLKEKYISREGKKKKYVSLVSFIFVMLCNLFANRDCLEKFSALQKIWKSDVQLLPIYQDEWSNPLYTFDSFHVSWLFVFDSVTASLMDAALETSRLERLWDVRVSLNATQTGVIEMSYTNSSGEMTGPQTVPDMSCRPARCWHLSRQQRLLQTFL